MYAYRRALLAPTFAVLIAGFATAATARDSAPPADASPAEAAYAAAENDGPVALSPADRLSYTTAFDALRRGDLELARASARRADDRVLLGQVEFERLFHPDHVATYEELAAWLEDYADLNCADRVFNLAMRRRPDGAAEPRRPGGGLARTWSAVAAAGGRNTESDPAKVARVAFNNDDLSGAYGLGVQIGDWWTAGLAAYRLNDFARSLEAFDRVATDPTEDPWVRAGAGVWASKAALASGRQDRVADYLRLAARWPATFYGQVALRQLGEDAVVEGQGLRPYASLQQAAYQPEFTRVSSRDLNAFIRSDDRARRAVALMEVGRRSEAETELKAGLRTAAGDTAHRMWLGLVGAVAPLMGRPSEDAARIDATRYATPVLTPEGGFTIEPALVYALARKETGFNPSARSSVGAYGMMQVMPGTAAEMTGDRGLASQPNRLLEPGLNLRLGQTYINRMLARPEFQGDVLRAVASYNAGPGPMLAALKKLGPNPDPLLLIETIDVPQARDYVEKVMASYWIYQRMFGGKLNTLDAVAAGQPLISIMLDYTPPPPAPAQPVEMASAPTTPGGL